MNQQKISGYEDCDDDGCREASLIKCINHCPQLPLVELIQTQALPL